MTQKHMLHLANKALKAGDAGAAAGYFRAVLAKMPRHAAALKGLKKLEGRAGMAPVSGAEIEAVIAQLSAADFAGAEATAQALIRRAPDLSGLYNIRGLAQGGQARDQAALGSFRKAFQLDGRNYEALNNLGLKLRETGQPHEARKALQKAIAIKPGYAQALFNLGTVLVVLAEYDAAETALRAAIDAMPGLATAWCELGKLQALRGFDAAAAESLREAIRLDRGLVGAYGALASVVRFEASDAVIGAMVRLVEDGSISGLELAALCFALGKAFEDAGAIDRSFGYYALGNQTQRRFASYNEVAQKAEFGAIKAAFGAPAPAIVAKAAKPQPIFIVGMNRSGTTLVEQILAGHARVGTCGELEDFSRFAAAHDHDLAAVTDRELHRFRSGYLAGLRHHTHAQFAIDKMPANFKYIGLIRRLFPTAPIICLDRAPQDLCFSNYKASVESTGHMYSYDQRDLARYYLMHRDLMAHWDGLFGTGLYQLSYEALTQSPEAEIRALLVHVGLAWDPDVMNFHTAHRVVKTLSQSQVRRAVNQGSVGAWRKFESHLGPMLEELAKGGAIQINTA